MSGDDATDVVTSTIRKVVLDDPGFTIMKDKLSAEYKKHIESQFGEVYSSATAAQIVNNPDFNKLCALMGQKDPSKIFFPIFTTTLPRKRQNCELMKLVESIKTAAFGPTYADVCQRATTQAATLNKMEQGMVLEGLSRVSKAQSKFAAVIKDLVDLSDQDATIADWEKVDRDKFIVHTTTFFDHLDKAKSYGTQAQSKFKGDDAAWKQFVDLVAAGLDSATQLDVTILRDLHACAQACYESLDGLPSDWKKWMLDEPVPDKIKDKHWGPEAAEENGALADAVATAKWIKECYDEYIATHTVTSDNVALQEGQYIT